MKTTKEQLVVDVAGLIAEVNDSAGESTQRIADALGTSRAQVGRLMASDANPKWETIERLVRALGELRGQRLVVRLLVSPAASPKGAKR